jgi:putative polyhydroxyalkanoate system protein
MPSIDLRRRHHMDRQSARARVDEIAARMREKFGVESRWDADTLRLRHMGLDGGITVDDESVHVKARLGMLLAALKPRIEHEVREKLDAYFGPEADA